MLTDTHCHLDFQKFDVDREEVIIRACQAGVTRIIIPGINLVSSQSTVRLASSNPMLCAAVGIHPTEIDTITSDTLSGLRDLTHHPRVVAIGEIGLDYYWDTSPHDQQLKCLKEQLLLASDLRLPVILHFREKGDSSEGPCSEDLLSVLTEWTKYLRESNNPLAERPGVLHSFSGSLAVARQAMNLHFYIGVTGPVTYSKQRQELVSNLPLERLLVETDSPFLAPAPHRGKRNEPAFTALIADKIAAVHSCTREYVASIIEANTRRLFAWED